MYPADVAVLATLVVCLHMSSITQMPGQFEPACETIAHCDNLVITTPSRRLVMCVVQEHVYNLYA